MISKKAENKNNFYRNIIFTNSAREGWELVLKSLKHTSKILLPSYIGITEREGSGIYDPVCNTKTNHDFYLLNDDLSISITEIENKLNQEKYDLILLVHYFGFKIDNIAELVLLCKKHNVIVVEDCAHLYNVNIESHSTPGSYGDFAFYSLHKFFPCNTGGLLVQNNLSLSLDVNNKIDLKKNIITNIFSYDVKKIAEKRIENYNNYNLLLNEEIGFRKLKRIKDEDIPHNFPIIIDNNLREKLYFWLINKDITLIALYYQLIKPLMKKEYHSMHLISNNILNLPVHQDINLEDIKRIVMLLKSGIAELNK